MNTTFLNRYVNYFRYAAMVNEELDAFSANYDGKGTILQHCGFFWKDTKGGTVSPADFATRKTEWAAPTYENNCYLTVIFSDGPEELPEASITVAVRRDHVTWTGTANDQYTPVFFGDLCWGDDPEHSTYAVSLDRPGYGLRSACGPAVSKWDDALLDQKDGSLLRLDSDTGLRLDYSWEKGCYTFEAVNHFGVQVFAHYFEDRFQVPYRPVCKTMYPTPPSGWMTWYAVKFDACEEAVLENARLQKELFGDYGADTIWVDWEWYHNGFFDKAKPDVSFFYPDKDRYPHGLEYLAAEIKKYGFVPALWIAPTHEPVETEYIRENPDVILLDYMTWCGHYWMDISHPKFLNDFLPRAIRQVPAWGFEALKWDCLPLTLFFANRVHGLMHRSDLSVYESFRKVIQIARDILGKDFFMLSCSGSNEQTPLNACDLFDGARIGGDIFTWEQFQRDMVAPILRLYPYHNTVLYCDTDNVVLRPQFNDSEQARSRISIVSLLGLPVTFGDDLRELPADRVELLRRALPTLDIHPMDMREQTLQGDSLIVNLVVNRPFARWNVVDVINFKDTEQEITVHFSEDLGLDNGEYLVHEYWSDTFYGAAETSITVKIPAFGSAVLSVRKKEAHLQLVSTSRHISQGVMDLVHVSYDNGVLSGVSKVVKGDPYTIKAFDPAASRLLEKTIIPEATGEITWSIQIG